MPRAAEAVCWNREDGQAYRALVALPAPGGHRAGAGARRRPGARVTSWEHLPGEQPNMTTDEWHDATRCSARTRSCSRPWPRAG